MKSIASILVVLTLATGCASNGKSILGETTTVSPGWDRLKSAAVKAIKDPHVWAPLVAATALQINDYDTELSDHLREETPLFGSSQNASEMSDNLRDFTEVAYVSTALLVPTGDDNWLLTKGKLIGAEFLTVEATSKVTSNLKGQFERERPNGSNRKSLPSGHAATSSIQASMAQINIEHLPISETSKDVLDYSVIGAAGLTGWARVEAGMHYPSDVLAGYALGRFLGHIAHSFIMPDQQQIMLAPVLTEDTVELQVFFSF